jgi:drug/metabolite transporter (DMT)-like permease
MKFTGSGRSLDLKTILAFFAIYFIWSSTYLAIKYAVETIPPFLMMGTRSIVAGAILFLWSRFRGDEGVRKEHLPSLLIIGALFFLIGHGALAWAQQKVPSGFAALLVASEPMWIAIIESLAIRNFKIGFAGVAGLALGFVGMIVLIAPGKTLGSDQMDLLGTAAILIGTISWSTGAVYLRVAKLPKSSTLTAAMELIIGSILLYATGFASGEVSQVMSNSISLRSILALGYLILFGSIVAFTAYVWLLGKTSATRVATHTYVNPVIAVIIGWAVAQEPFSANTFIATAIITVSVYLVLKDQSTKPVEVVKKSTIKEPELV